MALLQHPGFLTSNQVLSLTSPLWRFRRGVGCDKRSEQFIRCVRAGRLQTFEMR